MKNRSGTGPPDLGVQRLFEGNRLAKDFQIRAYELAFLVPGSEAGATAKLAEIGFEKKDILTQGGIAA